MTRPTVSLLWSGTLYGTCRVKLFTSSHRPEDIQYEMQDSLEHLHKLCQCTNPWVITYIPMYESGTCSIPTGANPEDAVATIIDTLLRRYAEETARNYSEIRSHGSIH